MSGVLVVNADDLGVSRGATLGIMRAHLEGVVTSASLSPTGADYPHAVEAVKQECPDLGIGLHFTLSAGKPVSAAESVPLLVDDQGFFRWEFVSLLKALRSARSGELIDQIAIELEGQIQRLLDDGIVPDHINSERHVHLIPGIFDQVIRAAKRHGIPFVRAADDVSLRLVRARHFEPVILRGGILKFALLQGLTHRNRKLLNKEGAGPIRFCDGFASYLFTGRLDLVLDQLVARAPAGIIEIMVHPGIPEESRNVHLGNPGLEEYLKLEDRRRELRACIQARSRYTGVEFSNFGKLAKR